MATDVSQFAVEVVNFSSQYGTQGSNTYTACNLAGGLRIYDGYGDRTEAFVLVCLAMLSLTRPFLSTFILKCIQTHKVAYFKSFYSSHLENFDRDGSA